MPDEVNLKHVRQDVPGLRKRWFQGDLLDLSIWQNSEGDVMHFQLLLEGDRIIDYQVGRGLRTGKVDQGRSAGMHPASALVNADVQLDVDTLQFAFREFVESPPMSQKRVLKFVAETLHAALTNPTAPIWPDSKLPPGVDSALMDVAQMSESVERLRAAKQREGMIDRLLARFRGSK